MLSSRKPPRLRSDRKEETMEFKGIFVVDFGGQYNQLIARRVREASVYCEIVPYSKCLDRVKGNKRWESSSQAGRTVYYEAGAPTLSKELFDYGYTDLGICYGAQLMAYILGGEVLSPDYKEYEQSQADARKLCGRQGQATVCSLPELLMKAFAG